MPTEPIDLDAEGALLGSLLSDPDTFLAVEDLVDDRMFRDPVNALVARAVLDLLRAKKQAEPVSVQGWLRDHGHAEDVDLTYLLDLMQKGTGISTVVRTWAERLRNLWALRERKRIARDILNDEDTGAKAEEKLATDASRLLAIETGKVTTARKAAHVILDRLETLEAEQKAGPEDRWRRQVPTGIAELDEMLHGLEPGELVLIAARPGVGKSALAVAISEHTGSVGIPTGIFWLEDYAKQWATRVLARRSKVPASVLRHGSLMRKADWERIQANVMPTAEWPIYVDDTHGLTARQVAQRMRRLHRDHGCRVFLADHLGEFRLDREERWGERHDLSMGDAMRIYRDTAADLGAVPILMAQLGRENEKRGGEPKLSDIYGSGIAEQVVRVAIFLSREKDGGLRAQIVKNTNGPKGEVALGWDPDTMSVLSIPKAAKVVPLPARPRWRPPAAPIAEDEEAA